MLCDMLEKKQKFITDLCKWIKAFSFEKVIILSSSFSQYMSSTLSHNEKYPIRLLTTSLLNKSNEIKIDSRNHLEKVDPYTLISSENGVYYLPGSGNTKSLFNVWYESILFV